MNYATIEGRTSDPALVWVRVGRYRTNDEHMEDIMARIDHTNCTHPRTPAGRKACRNAGTAAPAPDYIAEHIRKVAANWAMKARMDRDYAEIRMTGPVARRMARTAAKADRIQPRRSGARVAATSSTCVQAALHIDAHGGRCACGWVAA